MIGPIKAHQYPTILGFKLSVAQEDPELSFGHGLRLGHSKRDLSDDADCFQKLKGLARLQ